MSFRAYIVIATFCYTALGWPHVFVALGFDLKVAHTLVPNIAKLTHYQDDWDHRMSPIVFTLIYFLCIVMCLAVGTMLTWHLWGVAVGETAVESHDHEHYQRVAESRGEVCLVFRLSTLPDLCLRPSKTRTTLGLFSHHSDLIPTNSIFQKTQESPTLF